MNKTTEFESQILQSIKLLIINQFDHTYTFKGTLCKIMMNRAVEKCFYVILSCRSRNGWTNNGNFGAMFWLQCKEIRQDPVD